MVRTKIHEKLIVHLQSKSGVVLQHAVVYIRHLPLGDSQVRSVASVQSGGDHMKNHVALIYLVVQT